MSKFGLVIVMVLMAGRINAQNYPAPTSDPPTYFVLIQADDRQAFYIRLDSQLRPSSPEGHLILARLKDSAYMITVGFPGQNGPGQRYLLTIGQKDRAFHLSHLDNSWKLIDDKGNTMPPVADTGTAEMPLLAGVRKDDAFSQMMAAIVRDTAVMYNTYAVTSDSVEPPASSNTPAVSLPIPDSGVRGSSAEDFAIRHIINTVPTINPSSLAASSVNASIPIASPGILISPIASPAIPSSPTGVVKLSEHKSIQSLSFVYADHLVDKKTDTIDVTIPIENQSTDTSRIVTSAVYVTRPDSTTYIVHTDDTFHATRMRKPAPDTASRKTNLPFINSDCHAFATDYDVDKLRVRMLNANKDGDRIQTAYRIFKTKCFSTNQVSALCAVFTTEPAKFKFLETAYPFVSDNRFAELVNLFSDPMYMGKFRTMTGGH